MFTIDVIEKIAQQFDFDDGEDCGLATVNGIDYSTVVFEKNTAKIGVLFTTRVFVETPDGHIIEFNNERDMRYYLSEIERTQ